MMRDVRSCEAVARELRSNRDAAGEAIVALSSAGHEEDRLEEYRDKLPPEVLLGLALSKKNVSDVVRMWDKTKGEYKAVRRAEAAKQLQLHPEAEECQVFLDLANWDQHGDVDLNELRKCLRRLQEQGKPVAAEIKARVASVAQAKKASMELFRMQVEKEKSEVGDPSLTALMERVSSWDRQPALPDVEGCAPPAPHVPPVPAAEAREMKTPRSAEAVLKRRAESYVPPRPSDRLANGAPHVLRERPSPCSRPSPAACVPRVDASAAQTARTPRSGASSHRTPGRSPGRGAVPCTRSSWGCWGSDGVTPPQSAR